MATATPPAPAEKVYTTADLLAMPDDGVERWIIDGRLHEFRGGNGPMTIRNKHHTRVESRVSHLLESWREALPEPRGAVHAGEVGVALREDPDLTVGIDVVYLSPDVAARNESDDGSTIIVGVPVLAVEILSPSDTIENIQTRTTTLRDAGVPLVWVINPYMRTVSVIRPGRPPVVLNEEQELDGSPELPGFRVPVARLFRR
jgi:Uma2 family endonuclease